MISMIRNGLRKEQEVRDEEGVVSHAGYNVEQVQFHEQSAKVVMLCKSGEACCRKNRKTIFFFMRCRQEGQRLKRSKTGYFLFGRGLQKMGLQPKVIILWAKSWKQRWRGGP